MRRAEKRCQPKLSYFLYQSSPHLLSLSLFFYNPSSLSSVLLNFTPVFPPHPYCSAPPKPSPSTPPVGEDSRTVMTIINNGNKCSILKLTGILLLLSLISPVQLCLCAWVDWRAPVHTFRWKRVISTNQCIFKNLFQVNKSFFIRFL